MPDLPDLTVYAERLSALVIGQPLEQLRLGGPFFLRTVEPRPADLLDHRVVGVRRYGKRIALELEGELLAVIHLMIAGRLRWRERGTALPKKRGLAALDLPVGTLLVTEEGSKKRASLHLVQWPRSARSAQPRGRRAARGHRAEIHGRPHHGFPEKVTAFREGFTVHGRFGQPCRVCGTKVQRIVRGAHETNYCPSCQTGGKLLADRALSGLLGKDWPKTLDELEQRKAGRW